MGAQTSAAARGGTPLDRLGQTLRDLMDRVRKLEQRSTVTVGDWRLRQDVNGNLIAENTATSTTTTIASR